MDENNFYLDLLRTKRSPVKKQFENLLKTVTDHIPSIMASIWLINERANTVSILTRFNYTPGIEEQAEYVHPLENSLIDYLIKEIQSNSKLYLDISSVKEAPYWSLHLFKNRVEMLNLNRLVFIPIPITIDRNIAGKFDAIINLYPKSNDKIKDEHIEIIIDQFSIALSTARLLRREKLTTQIINIYEKRGRKSLSNILYPIINDILKKYLPYEGCSVFFWDPALNRLSLSQTTGIVESQDRNAIYYYLGEGLTGNIAKSCNACIINDLENIDGQFKGEYIHKFREITTHNHKTFMAIPIMSPSKPEELLGIIRFTNRLNMKAKVLDYFSDYDMDLVKHACNLIALYMEYEQSEKVKFSFAALLSHEMSTPASSIRVTSNRLIENINSKDFAFTESYLSDIYDQSSLQIALIDSISLLWKKNTSKKYIYDVTHPTSIENEVLLPSKKLVIPFARQEGVSFSAIKIGGWFPRKLFIDRNAFQQVFFNLLTNAIKYRKKDQDDLFSVVIHGVGPGKYSLPNKVIEYEKQEGNFVKESYEGFLIKISDNGIGLKEEELFKIFLQGYRAEGIEKQHVRGLGLGLTVVKRVIDDFECKIWVSSCREPTSINILIPGVLKEKDYLVNKWKN